MHRPREATAAARSLLERCEIPGRPRRLARPARFGQDGFTLLEVMIAFAIASIALAVVYSGALGGLAGSRLAARTDEAVARARSRLAAVCERPFTLGEQSGDDGGGYTWRTRISRTASEIVRHGDADPPVRADLLAVQVTETWPGPLRPHQISLESRCLSVGAPDRP